MNRTRFLTLAVVFASQFVAATGAQQKPGTENQEHAGHAHGQVAPLTASFPRLGRSQQAAGEALMTLEQALETAQANNPTLRQAEAEIRAAKARQQQSGLYPNPTVGYTGDEIRGGSVGGGKQGFFLQQTIVTGGKLSLARDILAKESRLAEIEAEEQRIRVHTAVKMAFIRVLAAQELLDARRDLARIESDSVETEHRLANSGQADDTEVLGSEVDAQRARMAARMQENTLREEWRSLAAATGKPDLPPATLAGDLERGWPELDEEQAVESIANLSPAIVIAENNRLRALAVLARAKKESVPDLQVRAGAEYNHETLGSVPFAKGWEGIAELSAELPIFNRNQGNVAAARADIERSEQEKRRVALTLRERAASAVDQYANARLMATVYRDEILPRAKKAYALMFEKYGLMLASYPRVLVQQRKLYELQTEYIMALEALWTNGLALEGYLLTDGLEAPARPVDVDRPIRETNVPMPERTMAPADHAPSRP
jgi:cobalt-zinc-cadmium efflux system outer membrane protein